jgi:hypothetical protein
MVMSSTVKLVRIAFGPRRGEDAIVAGGGRDDNLSARLGSCVDKRPRFDDADDFLTHAPTDMAMLMAIDCAPKATVVQPPARG